MLNIPAIHPTYLRLLVTLLRERGIDANALLGLAGIDAGSLPQRRLPVGVATTARFVELAMQRTACPWLGLAFGNAMSLAAHGPVGYAAVASRDLDAMLDVVQRYGGLRMPSIEFRRTTFQNSPALVLRQRLVLGSLQRFLLDAVLASLCHIIASNFEDVLPHTVIHLPWPAPAWADEYQQVADGATLLFDADELRFCFTPALLSRPSLMADESITAQGLPGQLQDAETALSVKVLARLGAADNVYPTLDETAQALHMTPRTLIRHLKAEGCSYQSLLDESRKARAEWWLCATDLPVEVIADRLGFQDTSNFSRTFRRWFGVTPSALRAGSRL